MSYPPGYTSPAPPGVGGPPPAPWGGVPAPGTYQLASWGARAGAALIDGIVVGVPALLVFLALGVGIASTGRSHTGVGAIIAALLVATLVFVVVAVLYSPLMMARTNGRTVGRIATGIRVIRANGRPMTFGFAFVREIVVKTLLFGTVGSATIGIVQVLDVLWPLWDDENRALHDMVVDTRVVRA